MKINFRKPLAKAMAVVLAFGLLATSVPVTQAKAATKPSLSATKATIYVGKTTTVKVKGSSIKSTAWTSSNKNVSLSSKKKASVVVKGLKAGTATVTAKIKVGKKVYTKTCKVTVKAVVVTATPKVTAKPTAKPTVKPTATPVVTAVPTATPVNVVGTKTVDETQTYSVPVTELNETTMTCAAKRPADAKPVCDDIQWLKTGGATFTANGDYNSGVCLYANAVTDPTKVVDATERGEGYKKVDSGVKDVSDYDYIRVSLKTDGEMNLRTYNDPAVLISQGFPGTSTSETYEGGWVGPTAPDAYMTADGGVGKLINAGYEARTLFVSIPSLLAKGMDPTTLVALAFCPQRKGTEVTINSIDFVKVKVDKAVTSIAVTGPSEIANGKFGTAKAAVLPADASKSTVVWTSSDTTLATVNFAGQIAANDAAKSGDVIITATARDGSGVKGSYTLHIGVAAVTKPIKSVVVDMADASVVAKGNTGSATVDATEKVAAGITFPANINMAYVDLSAYLTAKKVDLTNYSGIKVDYKVVDAAGKVVTANAGATYGKVAAVASAKLNGYDGGINAWMSDFINSTVTASFIGKDAATVAGVAGFNIQMQAVPTDCKLVVSKITIIKDYNTYVGLEDANIVAKGNTGSATVDSTKSATQIDFPANVNMAYVDLSAYLTANKLDLTNYKGIKVDYKVVDAAGKVVTANAGATYGKVAAVPSAKLNGFDGGINAWLSNFITASATASFIGKDAATVAAVAGFNFQLQAVPTDAHIAITGITLLKDYNVNVDLAATGLVAKGNTGSASVDATLAAAGISFPVNINMGYVDFSAYLTANKVDLTEYNALRVTYSVVDAAGKTVTANATATYGKVAAVASAKLNGYDGGVNAWMSNYIAATVDASFVGKDAATVSGVAGFNIQLQAVPADAHIVVTEITFVYDM